MYKEILRSIAGVEVFPVISLIVFVTFFSGMLVWVARMDRRRAERFAALPLDENGDERLVSTLAVEERR